MINNKGQVLVVFVILLPIFLLILTGLIDLALLNLEVKKLNSNTHDALEYYLDNYEEEDVLENTKTLLNKNMKNIEININDSNDKVIIKVEKNYKSIYSVISKKEHLISKYIGDKETKKIIKG